MNPIETLKTILGEMDRNKNLYVANPQKDFTRKRKVTFYGMMWFMLFIGANSMSEEIRHAFNDKDFSHISEVAILKSRSKIKCVAFEHLFHNRLAKPKNLKYRYEINFKNAIQIVVSSVCSK